MLLSRGTSSQIWVFKHQFWELVWCVHSRFLFAVCIEVHHPRRYELQLFNISYYINSEKERREKHNTYLGARKNQDRSRSSEKTELLPFFSWLSRVNLCGSVSFAISFLSKVYGQRCSCDYIGVDHRQWLAEELCA